MKCIPRRKQLQSAESLYTRKTSCGVFVVESGNEIRLHLREPIRISTVRTEECGYGQSPLTVMDHLHLSVVLDGEHYLIRFGREIDAIVSVVEHWMLSGIRKAQQRSVDPFPRYQRSTCIFAMDGPTLAPGSARPMSSLKLSRMSAFAAMGVTVRTCPRKT